MKYKVTLPIEIDVDLDAANGPLADQKAERVVEWFLSKLTPYQLNTPEFGALKLTLQPDREPAEPVTPDEVDHTQPFEGTMLIPADHPAYSQPVAPTLGGALRGEEWGGQPIPEPASRDPEPKFAAVSGVVVGTREYEVKAPYGEKPNGEPKELKDLD